MLRVSGLGMMRSNGERRRQSQNRGMRRKERCIPYRVSPGPGPLTEPNGEQTNNNPAEVKAQMSDIWRA